MTFKKLWKTKITSLMTIIVIGIALALPSSFSVLLSQVKVWSKTLDMKSQISVFLKPGIVLEQRNQIQKLLSSKTQSVLDPILKQELITKEQALHEMKSKLELEAALNLLDENPLPDTFVLTLDPEKLNPEKINSLLSYLRALPEVEAVQWDQDWINRLTAGIHFIKHLMVVLGLLFALAVFFIIGNTLRLHIENQKEEIEIAHLVGATNAFVRRPFLYLGFWYGVFGAFIAAVLVFFFSHWIYDSALKFMRFYDTKIHWMFSGIENALLLIILGGVLGIGGAFFSVRRHLKTLMPT